MSGGHLAHCSGHLDARQQASSQPVLSYIINLVRYYDRPGYETPRQQKGRIGG